MKQFLVGRWFLLALAGVLAVGFTWSAALLPLAEQAPRRLIVAGVLFLMALPLDVRSMGRALRRPGPVLLAIAMNFGLAPPVAWLVAKGLPFELGAGLIIIASIPCTLASAAVWTRRAGGADSVAILVTMITNLACFLVTPFWLRLLLRAETSLELWPLIVRLAIIVVAPMVLGQLLRLHRPLANWATEQKLSFGVAAQCGILCMVGVGVVRAGDRLASVSGAEVVTLTQWAAMIAAVLGVHLAVLAVGHALAATAGMSREDRIAVGFSGSQKTLMVGLDIGLQFFTGLTILPMVAYHVGQLLVDTLIADRLRRKK
jgi:sodium/bile acid cotransporter 7